MLKIKSKAARLLLAAGVLLSATACAEGERYDIAITGGRVIDPETGLDAIRNVGINGSQIAVVTEEPIRGAKEIDATDRVVSPGFIDLHAHGQTIPAARMQAMDGVTTGLELEAGALPVGKYYEDLAKQGRPINYGASVNWGNARIAAFLNVEPDHDIKWFFENFHNPIWQTSIATDEQLAKIKAYVEQGLDEGGLGIGFLLGYAPGTGHKEYHEVSMLAAERDLPTFTHTRFLSTLEPQSSFEGIQELVAVAAATGVHAHINHINSISISDIDATAALVAGAQEQGVKVTTEAYPYGAGATGIGAAMFRGENWRERTGGMHAHSFELEGKRLTEEEFAYLQKEKPGTGIVAHFLDITTEEGQGYLDKSILLPGGIVISDGGPWSVDGKPIAADTWPIPENAFAHPRSAGSYARFLRDYVRERKKTTLLDAIDRMSYGPARLLEDAVPQMKKKGRLQAGADADVVVFDLATVSDKATYAKPAQASVGFDYVIVNGVPLVKEGVLDTSVLPGQPVRNQSVSK